VQLGVWGEGGTGLQTSRGVRASVNKITWRKGSHNRELHIGGRLDRTTKVFKDWSLKKGAAHRIR